MKEVEFIKANTIEVTMMLAEDKENRIPNHKISVKQKE